MGEKIHVYVYPQPKGYGAAKAGYFIGDPFGSMEDARAFIENANSKNPNMGKIGRCRLVPASALN